ncbi:MULTISPECIES: hypothetical protein [unclassified Bradyrhizobium]|uniref:hypothetical protein n=1 Tax=unclassified Bradyrhizobium TaxID=2631580 RepID=UPI001FF9E3F0|nr:MULTISPECIES: hypothetical protein [unclassified Bradyrhizobium]MCK1270827.1 hypothetical protein [Bradyrhizobium sp. 84]MCK1372134.1 hypothetical protein [Bradyrhizobium sp. 49]MCK1430665.1 hypothetical protein [Bradyrhizobium sp. 87]
MADLAKSLLPARYLPAFCIVLAPPVEDRIPGDALRALGLLDNASVGLVVLNDEGGAKT